MDALWLYGAFLLGGFIGFAVAAFLSSARDDSAVEFRSSLEEMHRAGVITSPRPCPPTARLMPSDVTGKATLDGANDAPITANRRKYRVMWRKGNYGRARSGALVNKEVADATVRAMNLDFPDINHWAEPEDA